MSEDDSENNLLVKWMARDRHYQLYQSSGEDCELTYPILSYTKILRCLQQRLGLSLAR